MATNGAGSARPWEECRVDVYHRIEGLEGWTRAQGERCDRLHTAWEHHEDAEHKALWQEIGPMRDRVTRIETKIVVVVGIATIVAGVIGHVLARMIGG